MKRIYIFNESVRAGIFGIGTYVSQIINFLLPQKGIEVTLVELKCSSTEIEVKKAEGYNQILIPLPTNKLDNNQEKKYYTNCWYIIQSIINFDKQEEFIFHFNYYKQAYFIEKVKEKYPFIKILYTIHYHRWLALVRGDISKFKKIINSKFNTLKSDLEKEVYNIYENDHKLFNQVDRIICLNETTLDLLKSDYKIPLSRIELIYNGLYTKNSNCYIKQNKSIPKPIVHTNEKIILYVGRLQEMKGVNILIQSFIELIKEYSACKLIIVGDGDLCLHSDKAKEVKDKIIFTGRLEKQELYRLYRIASIGVIPSFYEQCSYVVIEMLTFGIPIIVSERIKKNNSLDKYDNIKFFTIDTTSTNLTIINLKSAMLASLHTCFNKKDIIKIYYNHFHIKQMQKSYLKIYNI